MSYCSVENIESRFPNINFTTSTSVTTSDVEGFILLNDAHIDGRLNNKYTTPITGTEALKIVRKISEFLTTADVQEILDKQMTKDEKTDKASKLREVAEGMLKAILTGTLALSDATQVTADTFSNYNVNNSIAFVMKKDTRQW